MLKCCYFVQFLLPLSVQRGMIGSILFYKFLKLVFTMRLSKRQISVFFVFLFTCADETLLLNSFPVFYFLLIMYIRMLIIDRFTSYNID